MLKHKLLFSVSVHYKNGEKQKLALVETDREFVIAPYYISEEEGWRGSGAYLSKESYDVCRILDIFVRQLYDELDSAFVEKITL